jgi:hypothetical protein
VVGAGNGDRRGRDEAQGIGRWGVDRGLVTLYSSCHHNALPLLFSRQVANSMNDKHLSICSNLYGCFLNYQQDGLTLNELDEFHKHPTGIKKTLAGLGLNLPFSRDEN